MTHSTRVDLSSLHHVIMEFVIDHAFVPDAGELAERLGTSVADVEHGLRDLQDHHGVVLYPDSTRIWVVHPFSAAPTKFVVRSGSGEWWAPCAWCALGAAALLRRDTDIVTTLGATSTQVTLRVRGIDDRYVVHFPVPMQRAWDNVMYTCSTMLLFDREKEVARWSERHGIPRGDVRPVGTVWELAKVWYGRHRDADWRKWSVEEAREIFSRFGLTGEIWALPDSRDRF